MTTRVNLSQEAQECMDRGGRLARLLQAPSLPHAYNTPLLEVFHLPTCGWSTSMSSRTFDSTRWDGVAPAVRDLRLPPQPDDESYVSYTTRHRAESRDSSTGRTFPPTNAVYKNVMNLDYGALFAIDNQGPSSARPGLALDSQVPLRHWSDVVFLAMKDLAFASGDRNTLSRLKYVFRVGITAGTTKRVICEVHNGEQNIARWPGRLFYTNTREGQALLGTPNGQGVGWLLAQHKAEFGLCRIEVIQVWFKAGALHMLFEVVR